MALLTDFTFKDTGITVQVRKVSPLMAADIAKAIPEPKPPEQEVDYGEPRGLVMEKNWSDPAYLAAVSEYRRKVSTIIQRVMITKAVKVEGEDWKKEVEEYRAFFREQTDGYELDEKDDLVVYVTRICVGSEDDLAELLDAITKRSQPTLEAVDDAKRSFPSKV